MKKLLLLSTFAIVFTFLSISCDKDEEDHQSSGKKAAKEFCNCFKKNTRDYCEKELNKNYWYSKDSKNLDIFMEAFNNEAATCGIYIYQKN